MPSFTNNYTEPGTYVVINDDISTDVNTGLLSVCIIGKGKETKSISNELLELLPPIERPTVPVIGTEYEVGSIVYYNDTYYRVTTTSTPEAAQAIPGEFYSQSQVISFGESYYIVNSEGTIPAAIDPEDGTACEVGDILFYNDKYYSVTTAGTVTEPVADWLEANASEITEDVAVSSLVTPWLDENASVLEDGVDEAIFDYWISTDTEETTIHYKVWTPETDYVVGDFIYLNALFYECIKDHTSPSEANINYLNTNWKIVDPNATYYSAQLQPEIVVAPSEAVDAISSRVYDNSEKDFFAVENSVLLWKAPDGDMPVEGPDGKYKITVSYTVAKNTADREPKSYTRLSSIYAVYGEPSAENTISAGAQVAYDNGARVFYCIQPEVNETTGLIDAAGLSTALRQATKINAYCILPMVSPFEIENDPDNSITMAQIISMCKTHVENMSSTLERKERIAIVSNNALIETEDYDTAIETYKKDAASANSARVVYVTPGQVSVTLDTGTVAVANGMYAAAAIAGIICNNNFTCGEPITGKTLSNVTVNDRYTREEKNVLASYGCLVLEGAEGTSVAKIRHALSTSTGDYVKSEIKITKIKDVISNTLRLALDKAYINTRFVGAATISEMTATVNTILSSFLANNDIYSYTNLVIAQDQNYPNQINVSFRIYPTPDVNYILVTFGVTFQNS